MNYRLSSFDNKIFLIEFDNNYDLAMHFLRVQEYYESPNEQFRGKLFDIWEYIEWYSREHNDSFTYAADWAGFNIPGDVFNAVYLVHSSPLPGHNKYDNFMKWVCKFIELQKKSNDFYVIGTLKDDVDCIRHEMAHAMWATNDEYRASQTKNLDGIRKSAAYKAFCNNLGTMGYNKVVFDDEVQAWLSTGTSDDFAKGVTKKTVSQLRTMFSETFDKFYVGP